MPRNGSGTSSVINTFVIDTIADPDEVNANFTDVADQLTNSLPRDGQAGMNAPLPLQNGTAPLPALTFASDPDTGFYRSGANKIGVALGGVGYPLDAGVVYAAKAGNYTAVAGDNNAVIRFTATSTLTLDPVATLGANWHVTIIADGGDVTIDPDGSETIDGAATLFLKDGQVAYIINSGTAFFATITNRFAQAAKGQLYGLTLSNNVSDATNDIDIAAGEAASDGTTAYLMALAASLTKRLDAAWAVGTNQGGLDTGSKASSTTYFVWLIQRSDTGVVDALFSTSSTSPTMPTNYDRKRLIGVVMTDGSSAIRPFTMNPGDDYTWTTPVADVVNFLMGTVAGFMALTVPSGVKVRAKISTSFTSPTVTNQALISSPDQGVLVAGIGNNGGNIGTIQVTNGFVDADLEKWTNTSRQLRYVAGANGNLWVWTNGFVFPCGRN